MKSNQTSVTSSRQYKTIERRPACTFTHRAGIGLASLVPLPEGQMLAMDAPDGHLPDLGGMLHPAEFPSGLDVVRCGGEGLDDGPEDA